HVHVVGEVLPGAGHAAHLRLPAELPFHAHFARHAHHFRGEGVELIDHGVDGVLQLEDLPFTSTVIFFDRSPVATAVVTCAMFRTWLVRFEAMKLTLSVRSFHVPATPRTCAWPPSFPSVPTSRATRVTSAANEFS